MQSTEVAARFLVDYGFKLLGAAVIATVGLLGARWLGRLVARSLDHRIIDPPVRNLVVTTVRALILGIG